MNKFQKHIGTYGVTATKMALTGFIKIKGKTFEAVSKTYLQPGTLVEVIGTSFHMLRVEKMQFS